MSTPSPSHHQPPPSVAPVDPGLAPRKKKPPKPPEPPTPAQAEALGKSLLPILVELEKSLRALTALAVLAKHTGGLREAAEFARQAKSEGFPLFLADGRLHPDVELGR